MPSAPQEIVDLVERFAHNADYYRSPSYNETQVRGEFLDPFFAALGWDIYNRSGVAPAYQSVILQATLRMPTSNTTMPDYCFRVGPERKFFVEAKKPSVDIDSVMQPAYQLRRYAWTAKLPLSILTDFEQFSVYDCRTRPNPSDNPAAARVLYITCDQYADRWDEIAKVFGREAVWRGDYDRYAETAKGKHGTQQVDDVFLQEIEQWRALLARNIALRNPDLKVHLLNYAVQQTIDRIIFLRICEDRGIEPYEQLKNTLNGSGVYARLLDVFRRADDRYNSGLFHFKAEKGREDPERITLDLHMDDKVLAEMIGSLYYPHSPYAFDVLGADILGNVYERFLGSVIRLTAGHQAKVEQKPEVKKAGGVYYTPKYIVDYIVKHTVGKLCEGQTPSQITRLRILDPACGSGSFLLGAYQYLLDYHLNWYVENPTKQARREVYQGPGGAWFLTTAEKKRILTNNLYGVDIDAQAVEVTKLSLLLKVLEGENQETIADQRRLWQERALPDLVKNIKCGNSLIGPDYQSQQLGLLNDEEAYRVNLFDWNQEFSEIMRIGGFDVVIGNPPYVRPHRLEPEIKDYFWRHFTTFVKKADLYCCFVEKGVSLLRKGGQFGFIISNGWLRLDSFEILRKFLLDKTTLDRIIDFTDDVFSEANVKAAILVLSNTNPRDNTVKVATTKAGVSLDSLYLKNMSQDSFQKTYCSIFDLSINETQEAIKNRMRSVGEPLGDSFELAFGLKTGDDSKFLTYTPDTNEHKPLLRGEDVHRYVYKFKGEYVWYVPRQMTVHRTTARPGDRERFEQPKVLIRDTGEGLQGTFEEENYYVKDVLIISDRGKRSSSLKYLTGILNSKLMRFYYELSFPTIHVQRNELASLPIRTISFSKPADITQYDQMVALVECMLELHKRLASAQMPQEKAMLQRQVEVTDTQIDRLVYELYGLTEEEIAIVEGVE